MAASCFLRPFSGCTLSQARVAGPTPEPAHAEAACAEPSLPLHRPRAPEKHASPSPIRPMAVHAGTKRRTLLNVVQHEPPIQQSSFDKIEALVNRIRGGFRTGKRTPRALIPRFLL